MSYRDDGEALRIRRRALASELDELKGKRDELEAANRRIADLEGELADVRAKLDELEAKRSLPLLDGVRIASPCSESWDEMVGDDRVRFCGKCEKNVYNVVALSRSEAEQLITESEGRVCMRLYRRRDGTVLTSDCPVGRRRRHITRIAAAALAVGGAGLALAAMQTTTRCKTIGGIAVPSFDLFDDTEVMMGDVGEPPLMGSVAPVAEPPPQDATTR